MHSFKAVYARMLFAAGVRTQTELAKLLGIRQGSISDAKRRGSIPMNWCVRLFDVCGANVDWQRTGEGPVYDERKRERLKDPNHRPWDDPIPEVGYVLREPPGPSLEMHRPGTLQIFSVICTADGEFPSLGCQIFPAEFVREGITIFRLLDAAMAPSLNKGALVAVDRELQPADGEVAALKMEGQLFFRRVVRVDGGYALKADNGKDGIGAVRLIPDEQWGEVFYGKAVWAFQPL
jgi:hypothetical protein